MSKCIYDEIDDIIKEHLADSNIDPIAYQAQLGNDNVLT